ncbi:hypothetical protein BJ741DRAFT_610307, partial [Chytriomyces cf. hyalinus JEL632]
MSATRNTASQGPPPTEPPVSTQPTTAAPSTAEPSPSPSPIPSTQRTSEPSPSPQPSPTTSQQPSPSPPPPTSPPPSSPSPPPQTSSQQQQSPVPTSQAPAATDGPNGSPVPRPDVTTTSRAAVVEPSPVVFTSNGSTFTSKVPAPTVSGLTSSTVSSSISDNISNGSSSGSSTGVIIGVVVGIIGVLLIGGGVLWWRRINKPKSRRYNLDDLFTSTSANAQAPGARPFPMTRPATVPASSDVNRHEAASSEYSAVPVRSSTDFSQSHVSHHQPQQQQAPQFLMADGSNPYMNAQSQQQHAQAYYDAATLAYYQQQQATYYQQYGQYPPSDASYDSAQLQHQQQQYAAAYANQAASNSSQTSAQPLSEEKSSHMFNVYDNANRLSAVSAVSTEHSDFASPPAFIEKERLSKHLERGADANQWTMDEAVAWVTEKEYGDASTVALMKEQEIDGRSLLLLSNHDLEHTLKISDAKRRDRFEDAISELKRNSATLQQATSSGLPS